MTDTVKPVLATLLLVVTCAVLLLEAYRVPFSQDWIPFHVAARLAPTGEWRSLYPDRSAKSLLDVPALYRSTAEASAVRDGAPAFEAVTLTGFVSPPPAAFLLTPARNLSWETSARIWRFALTGPILLAFVLFATRQVPDGPDAVLRWSLLCACSLPIAAYLVVTGQPTNWLVLTAFVTVVAPGRVLDVIGAIALTLGVLTKATPVFIVAGLWIAGRRRLALLAGILSGAAVLASLPWAGAAAWIAFSEIAGQLGRTVITEWNNVSLDATLARIVLGVSNETMYTAPAIVTATAWIVRIVMVWMAVRVAIQLHANPGRRLAAVWIAWLAATPLLWLHYVLVLLPFLGSTSRRRPDVAVWLMAALSATFVLRVLDLAYAWVGNLSTIAWMAAALWLLSARAWEPDPVAIPARLRQELRRGEAISPARGSRSRRQ